MVTTTLRTKRCKAEGCGVEFAPRNSFQKVCSLACSVAFARQMAQKEQRSLARKEKAAGRLRLMTRSDWIKRAQKAFNAFIRARDSRLPCICCGHPLEDQALTGGGFDAGHYRSVGSAPHLRFVEDNVHGQRKACNQYGSGRAVDYRVGLIARIGIARVEALEADQAPRKYTIEQLKGIEAEYKAKLRELEHLPRAA